MPSLPSTPFLNATLLFVLLMTAGLSNSYAAKIYQWVDEQGKTHFSENPPRDIKAKTLNVKATGKGSGGNTASSAQNTAKTDQEKNKDKAQEKELKPEISPEEKAKYCNQSRELLQQMNGSVQRRFEQPDGSYRKLTMDEMDNNKVQARQGIADYCQ
mgnify:CR=1 FL=1